MSMTQQATQTEARKPLRGATIGKVVSDKRDKTRKVEVTFLAKAPKYGKYVRCRSYFQVHDEKNASKLGDTVEIAPCRPISKNKSWRILRVVEAAPGTAPAPGATPGTSA